jgi:hypothetical protein
VAEPLLRTLAPALRRLEQRVQAWLDMPRKRTISTLTQAALDGLQRDLGRQGAALDVEKPVLIITLMGGTGVGKSTLLNALAKAPIASASYARPTTREPVVYYHQSVRPDTLDPALQRCRLIAHDRADLAQKILVDTPDLDSNDLTNRDKLMRILPVADVVLYVGSQEKYHDVLGWKLFVEQRKRRAFAFVLNKWDRCLHGTGETGLRPDEDLLADLKEEGFDNPLLFRTCAQSWVEANGQPPADLPEGEQFAELLNWLEAGLTRLEIEAIKARGVGQLLKHLEAALENAKPPDLAEAAERTEAVWTEILRDEAQQMADILLMTIDPHQREIEQHFALEGHRRFRGLMAGFLRFATRLRYFGSSIRRHMPRPLRGDLAEASAATAWDLAAFSQACSSIASDRHLDARSRALPNQLLVRADMEGFPVAILSDPTQEAARANWRQRLANVLIEVLHDVEREWTQPSGPRRWLQSLMVLLGDILPLGALAGSALWLLYQFYANERTFSFSDLLLPLAAVLFTLIIFYVIILLVLPVRWPAIRNAFHRQLTRRLTDELSGLFLLVPREVAAALALERRQAEQLVGEVREVAEWLRRRETDAAKIGGLYGSES